MTGPPAPCPMVRYLSAKIIELMVIGLNVEAEAVPAQGVVLVDAWAPVEGAHIVRKRAASRARWRGVHVRECVRVRARGHESRGALR